MNRGLEEVGGQLLVVSQFTLYGNCRHGRRPDFLAAARPEVAVPLYEQFLALCRDKGFRVETGVFGADMVKKDTKQTFLGGAAILAAAVVIVKIIGAVYLIPLNNILGSEGKTYFRGAYNIYNVLMAFSVGGFPLAISKLTSEAQALGRENEKRRLFRTAMSAAPRPAQPRSFSRGFQQPLQSTGDMSFEDKLKLFMSSSEGKMADLNRNIDGKRGGRRRK